MQQKLNTYPKQPLGKLLSNIGKSLLNLVNIELNHLKIKRNFYALILIDEGKGCLTQQDLADLLEIDKVSVVRIVDYLSSKGYVKRMKVPTDRRKYGLAITTKAEKELPLIKNTITAVIQIALKGLSKKQIDEFNETLKIIKNNLNE